MLQFTPCDTTQLGAGVLMSGYITTRQAAELMGVTISYVRRLAREGVQIKAQMFGRDWQIEEESARAFMRSTAGFPVGKKQPPRKSGGKSG